MITSLHPSMQACRPATGMAFSSSREAQCMWATARESRAAFNAYLCWIIRYIWSVYLADWFDGGGVLKIRPLTISSLPRA